MFFGHIRRQNLRTKFEKHFQIVEKDSCKLKKRGKLLNDQKDPGQNFLWFFLEKKGFNPYDHKCQRVCFLESPFWKREKILFLLSIIFPFFGNFAFF